MLYTIYTEVYILFISKIVKNKFYMTHYARICGI